ncbi:uncharacterized protein LOC142318825 isoform X2 [Lycorma delicatula]|uniref:uncharacterized protein LOC142318825 isoform X2 n=1 Tax=Lycorma delicatula TaxID=130591 RepID=UPI003F518AF8
MKEGLEKDAKRLDNLGVKDGETSSDTGKKKGKEERPPTKVVVRRLPPTMTEEEFLQQIDPIPSVDYMYYVPADTSLMPHSFCRAYLNFVNQSDIFIFTQKFDGYVFVDSKGMEYPAVVEFAPFQRIPKQRPGRKKDPKAGTLENDVMYTSFLEKLQAQIQESTSAGSNMKQHFFETNVSSNEENKVNSTPLLDYLRTRHAERLRAREEKRKKDLERKKARDEQRRSSKKPEEEPSVVKVLPSQTNNKLKDRDMLKPVKKRNEDRMKETKGRVGKSYAEERQKQLEKREEQRKKFASNVSNRLNKLQSEQKSEHNSAESDKNQNVESKKTECDSKSSESGVKKDTYEKKSYHYMKSSDTQRHYDYSKRDDDFKRRSRDSDRISKTKEQYRDRREDRFSGRKKPGLDSKRNYDRYDEYNKDRYKKEHYVYRKEGSNCNGIDRKPDKEIKVETNVSHSSINKNESEKEVRETKKEELVHESSVKQVNLPIENVEFKKDNVVQIQDSSKSMDINWNKLGAIPKHLKNSGKTDISSTHQRRNSLESGGKSLSFFKQERADSCKDSGVNINTRRNSVESASMSLEDSESINEQAIEGFLEKSDDSNISTEHTLSTHMNVQNFSEGKNETENIIVDNDGGSQIRPDKCDVKSDEVVLKRRNSMENYERKCDNKEKPNRRGVRRSSLESGDQHSNCKQFEIQHKSERKKAEGDSSESKPKDPRTERRIRNKDRPSIEIYRPGMGKFSKQRMEREKVLGSSTEVESNSPSPSPTLVPKHKSSLVIVNHSRDS